MKKEDSICIIPFLQRNAESIWFQVWDYSSEDTITFNLLYTFEKENQIVQREIFEEKYYPIKKEMILSKLKMMGYTNISVYCFPSYFKMPEFELVDWYCIAKE